MSIWCINPSLGLFRSNWLNWENWCSADSPKFIMHVSCLVHIKFLFYWFVADLTINCCIRDRKEGEIKIKGIAIATCCHHLCQWKHYKSKLVIFSWPAYILLCLFFFLTLYVLFIQFLFIYFLFQIKGFFQI